MQEAPEPTVTGGIARRFHGFVVLEEKLGTFPLGQVPENDLRIARILVTDRLDRHAAKRTLRAPGAGRSTPPSRHSRSVPAACDKSGVQRRSPAGYQVSVLSPAGQGQRRSRPATRSRCRRSVLTENVVITVCCQRWISSAILAQGPISATSSTIAVGTAAIAARLSPAR